MFHCVFCRLNFIPSKYFSHRPYLQQTLVVCSVFVIPSAIAPDLGDLSLQPVDFGWTFPSPCSSAVQQQILQLSAAHACCTVQHLHKVSGSYLAETPAQLILRRVSTSAPSGAQTWTCSGCTSENHGMQQAPRKSQPRCERREPSKGLGLPLSSSVAASAFTVEVLLITSIIGTI